MSTDRTGADLFVEALEQYGIERVFGNPGTTELPVMEALGDSELEYVLGLHEDVAVGAAAGYASTRRYHAHEDEDVRPVGVVNLHVAPGVAHGLGNLLDAAFAGAPIVVTAGNHATDFRHEEPVLSGDLKEMTDQFCKWSDEVLDVSALPTMLRRAFRVALTPPTGPVFLGLPLDVTTAPTDADPEPLGSIPNAGAGDPEGIERAAEVLAAADEPVFVLGDGVAHAGREAVEAVVELAEATGARVHGEVLAAEVNFPTDHDQWVSYLPRDEESIAELQGVDTLAFIGCSTNTTLTRHEGDLVPSDAATVHVGADPWQLGKNDPATAAVVGDPGLVATDLAERVGDRLSEEERASRLDRVAATKETVAERAASVGTGEAGPDEPPTSKAELVDAVRTAASDAYVVSEAVTSRDPLLARWPFEPRQQIANKGGGLGYGLPAAVGAAIAESRRDDPRDVLAVVGDGSYLYYPHTLYTAARHDIDLTVVVPDNRNYRILKENTLDLLGGEEEDHAFVGMDFDPPVDIPANAESHGARGHRAESTDEIEEAVRAALDREGPDVIDAPVHD